MGPPSHPSGDLGPAAGFWATAVAIRDLGSAAGVTHPADLRWAELRGHRGGARRQYQGTPGPAPWRGQPGGERPGLRGPSPGGRPGAVTPPGRPPAYDHGVASGELRV